jgi:tetratricopeptide (TPR) repeat protein
MKKLCSEAKPMNLLASPRRVRQLAPFAAVMLVSIVAVAAYLQALHFAFVSDDLAYLATNTKLSGLRLSELWRLFTGPYNPLEFLPLRDLSYWFDITLFGLTPAAFRVHNIILYLLCLPLVYAATLGLWRYFRPADAAGAPWAAAAVTALFALHPAHVEAVVWISGRKDVLSGLFSLLALWLAVNARGADVRREQGLSPRYAAATLLALLAAMLSKATAIAVAPVIAMLWILFWRDIQKQDRRYSQLLWPLASLLLAACVAPIFMANSTIKLPVYFGIEAYTRTLAVLGWFVRLAISPESRHYLHPVLEDPWFWGMAALGVVVLIAAAAGVVMLRKRSLEGFALVTFLLLCMPYTQLTPYLTNSLVADRFLFLAAWPIALLIVALAWCLNPLPRIAILLAFALPWGLQTVERPPAWRSLEALIDADFHAAPGNYQLAFQKIFYFQLPQGLYREANETASNITVSEARDIMVKLVEAVYAVHNAAMTGDPHDAISRLRNLGPLLKQPLVQAKWNPPMYDFWKRSRNYFALEWQDLTERFPDDVTVRYNAGLSLSGIHEYAEAAVHLHAATESQQLPESLRGKALVFLGAALLNSEHAAEAEVPLRAALGQSPPDLRAYCVLAEVYKRTGRFEEAARAEADCRSRAPREGIAQ